MKKQLFCIVLIIVLSVFTEVQSQWIKAYNPYNGYVSCLSYVNSKIYAGSKGSLFVSKNNGMNWTSINLTDIHTTISCIAGNDAYIFVGTFGKGIFLSEDNGNSWAASNGGLPNDNITSLAIKDSFLLVGTLGNGVFRSMNYGRTWLESNTGVIDDAITSVFITDSVIFAGSSNGNIFLSYDYGNQWNLKTITNTSSISSFIKKDSAIFFGSVGGGVFISVDKGEHWSKTNNGLFNTSVTAMVANDTAIYAGTMQSGIFRSTNSGGIWNLVNNGLLDSSVTSLARTDSNIFAGTEWGGVFRSLNNGEDWEPTNTGLISINVNVFLTQGENIFAGTMGAGVLLSTDRGISWTELNSGLTTLNVVSLAILDSTVYAATDYYWVYKSTDYGNSWTPTTRVQINSSAVAVSDSIIYVSAGYDGVYRSLDGGNTWEYCGLKNNWIRPIAAKDSLVLAGSDIYDGVFLSSNYGKGWTSLGSSYAYSSINTVGWCGNNIVAGMDNGIFLRTAQDSVWARKGPKDYVYSMAIKDSMILAGTFSGVYLSIDWGEKWSKIDSESIGPIYALAIVGSELFAGDKNQNIWKTSISKVLTEVKRLPFREITEFSLHQNYPNPFNPITTIEFSIPFKEYTTLTIYDILGREVSSIVAQVLEPGLHTFIWNGNKLSSGIYFGCLKSGNFFETKKLLLLK